MLLKVKKGACSVEDAQYFVEVMPGALGRSCHEALTVNAILVDNVLQSITRKSVTRNGYVREDVEIRDTD